MQYEVECPEICFVILLGVDKKEIIDGMEVPN